MNRAQLRAVRKRMLAAVSDPVWTAVPKGQGHPVLEQLMQDRQDLVVELDETIEEFRELVRAIEADRNEVNSISGYLGARLTDARARIARWDES